MKAGGIAPKRVYQALQDASRRHRKPEYGGKLQDVEDAVAAFCEVHSMDLRRSLRQAGGG